MSLVYRNKNHIKKVVGVEDYWDLYSMSREGFPGW